MPKHCHIRDPIHGVIDISLEERLIIDSKEVQRLRFIKQLAFAEFAFPCATHSRFSHSLGAMHMASRIFDKLVLTLSLPKGERERFRQAIRMAALLHDLGHPPFSHSLENMLPKMASHEDFTLKIILDSPLSATISKAFSDLGISATMLASLLDKRFDDGFFLNAGLNLGPIFRQIISSEIDSDRMDYLLRDSFFCGVNYGNFDVNWLIENLTAVEQQGNYHLAFKARAIFAFEDFLLSRYHMFSSVYLHHTPIIMEQMLKRFLTECPNAFALPSDCEAYGRLSDADLWHVLRNSQNPWAKRIVERRPYVRAFEDISGPHQKEQIKHKKNPKFEKLKENKIDYINVESKCILSRYYGHEKDMLYVLSSDGLCPLEDFSSLFARYMEPAIFRRVYVAPENKERARLLLEF
jgi:HD superfamily phosphohydrolase